MMGSTTLREIVRSNERGSTANHQTIEMELRALKAESSLYRVAALTAKSTTERVLATSDDVLFGVF